jgi:hypothetical protein
MKSPAKCAAWLLPFVLTGCFHTPFHKNQSAQLIMAPPIPHDQPMDLASVELPPALRLIPGRPLYNIRVHDETGRPLIRHRRPANPPDIEIAPEVTGNQNPEVSAIIGQLSSGDPVSYRQQTEATIASIERGLNGIHRPLNDSDQKTADQIREFLKQARTALASGDVDGAHNLAAKAQVLLAALTQ